MHLSNTMPWAQSTIVKIEQHHRKLRRGIAMFAEVNELLWEEINDIHFNVLGYINMNSQLS